MSAYGATFGHFGVGLTVLGIVGMTAWRAEIITVLELGESRELAGFTIALKSVEDLVGYNYDGQSGIFEVSKGGKTQTLQSEHRIYRVTGQPTARRSLCRAGGPAGECRTPGLGCAHVLQSSGLLDLAWRACHVLWRRAVALRPTVPRWGTAKGKSENSP